MNKIALFVISLFVVACSTPKPSTTQQDSNSVNKAPVASTPSSAETAARTVRESPTTAKALTPDEVEAAKLAAEIQKLHNESVYFDYDQSVIKPDFRAVNEKQAAEFKNQKNKVMVLEGNADERGSTAYNLALGERRANSVKKALVTLGVAKSKIKTVSFGKSKPKLDCHEEKCWKENRRVDFVAKQ